MISDAQVVVLAGGLATRLRPITSTIPKALVLVNGVPFIDHQLKLFRDQGIREVLLCTGYLSEQIEEHVGDGSRFGVQVKYSREDPSALLGTAGALRLAAERGLLRERFLVTYGDSYLPTDWTAVWSAWEKAPEAAFMTVLRNAGRWDQSNVIYEEHRIKLYRKGASDPKMEYIDYGLLGLKSYWLTETIPLNFKVDLASHLERLSQDGQLAGFEVMTRFYEIGSPQGLQEFEEWLRVQT